MAAPPGGRAARRGPPPALSLPDAMEAPELFGGHFGGPSWAPWRAVLRALFGLPPGPGELELYRALTGRGRWPGGPAREAWVVAGRRSGKSRVAALLAVYLACFRDHRPLLAPGERGVVALFAADRRQARVCFGYVLALLRHPMLAPLVEGEPRAESVSLRGGVSVEVLTSSFRTARGFTLVGAVCDELAFWRDELSANPDAEVVAAIRPAMATTGGLLFGVSSPWARRGVLWSQHARHFGRDGDPVLVVQAPSRSLNPSLPEHVVAEAEAEDPVAAACEYGAQFRSDLESYADRAVVERLVVSGRAELAPAAFRYHAFADPSGGRADSFALCVAHREGARCVVDVLRERGAPFNPDDVVAEYASLCRAYGIGRVVGDRYAGAWVEESFRRHGLRYAPAALSKSELYVALLAQLNAGRVELPDVPALVRQLVALERRTSRGTGRDAVDHPPGGRDDLANALAGAVHLALGRHDDGRVTFRLSEIMPGAPPRPEGMSPEVHEAWLAHFERCRAR